MVLALLPTLDVDVLAAVLPVEAVLLVVAALVPLLLSEVELDVVARDEVAVAPEAGVLGEVLRC